jgi:hypothetical protein
MNAGWVVSMENINVPVTRAATIDAQSETDVA